MTPRRPATGIRPQISGTGLVTLAEMQALPGFTSEARWLHHARKHLTGRFPRLTGQSGYNKWQRKLASLWGWLIRHWPPIPACSATTCG
jgi:hypothetical protein